METKNASDLSLLFEAEEAHMYDLDQRQAVCPMFASANGPVRNWNLATAQNWIQENLYLSCMPPSEITNVVRRFTSEDLPLTDFTGEDWADRVGSKDLGHTLLAALNGITHSTVGDPSLDSEYGDNSRFASSSGDSWLADYLPEQHLHPMDFPQNTLTWDQTYLAENCSVRSSWASESGWAVGGLEEAAVQQWSTTRAERAAQYVCDRSIKDAPLVPAEGELPTLDDGSRRIESDSSQTDSNASSSNEDGARSKRPRGGRPRRNPNEPPRVRAPRVKGAEPKGHLWQFILRLLCDKSKQHLVRWVDKRTGVFCFVDGKQVAAMWGKHKNGKGMSYEYMSRAIRTYDNRLFRPCPGRERRLQYAFGPRANWREVVSAADEE